MDNRIFNVNGRTDEELKIALKLALSQEGQHKSRTIEGWEIDNKKGLVLYWYIPKGHNHIQKFPNKLNVEELFHIVNSFLNSEESNLIETISWDSDIDQDGHNIPGWRVYCEDWGRIDGRDGSYIAIKPAYMWMGK